MLSGSISTKPLVALVCTRHPPEEALDALERMPRAEGVRSTVTTKRGEIVAIVQWKGARRPICRASSSPLSRSFPRADVHPPAIAFGELATDIAGLRAFLGSGGSGAFIALRAREAAPGWGGEEPPSRRAKTPSRTER